MSYVIVTDSRKNNDFLFMVNRKFQRKSFWSNTLQDVMVFSSLEAAEKKCKTLRYNNPRVVTLSEAQNLVREQEVDQIHQQALSECEMGWDGHSCWTG